MHTRKWDWSLPSAPADPKAVSNEDVNKVSGFYLEGGRTLHCSKAAISQLTQTPAHLLEATLITVVNGMLHLDKLCRAQVEQACVQGKLQRLLHIDTTRFDETPMRVRIKEVLSTQHAVSTRDAAAAVGGAAPEAVTLESLMSKFFTQTSAMCKLFAIDNKFAILLKSKSGDETGQGLEPEYMVVQGPSLTHLQCLERATGPTMLQALIENLSISEHIDAVPLKVRSTCTDEAGSNRVAETTLVSSLGPSWKGLHFPCNVHKVARSLQKTMDLVQEHIAGLLHFALALETSSAMSQFRQALARVIAVRPFEILHGPPPPEVVAYRDFIMRLFGNSGTKLRTRRHLISSLLTGDWRLRDRIQIYVPSGFVVNKPELQSKVTEGILLALTSKAFSKYPQHRWGGGVTPPPTKLGYWRASMDLDQRRCRPCITALHALLMMPVSLVTTKTLLRTPQCSSLETLIKPSATRPFGTECSECPLSPTSACLVAGRAPGSHHAIAEVHAATHGALEHLHLSFWAAVATRCAGRGL